MPVYCRQQKCSLRPVCGIWRYKSLCRYSSGFAAEVVSNESAVVENAFFSADRYIFRTKFPTDPTGFTYPNLHGFARFPGDSTALVLVSSYET